MKKKHSLNEKKVWGPIIVFLGSLFYFYEYFLRVSPSVIEHQLEGYFGLTAKTFGTLSAFYFYAYTPIQLIVGIAVDKLKMRHILVTAIFCCALGTVIIPMSHDLWVAALGRFLQGFGSAFAFVGVLKLASVWLPEDRFATFSGFAASLGFIGAAVGEILLNGFVEFVGWKTALFIFGGFGFLLSFVAYLTMKAHPTPSSRDVVKGRQLKNLLKSLKDVMKVKQIWFSGVISFLMFLPTSVFASLWGIPYLKELHNYTDSQASLAVSMIFVGWAIGSPLNGYISDKLHRRMKIIGFGALLAFMLSVVILYVQNIPYLLLIPILIIFGIVSSTQVLTFAIATELSPHKAAGTAVAFTNTLAMLGGFIFQRAVGEMLEMNWDHKFIHGQPVYSISNFQHALAIIPICLFLAAVLGFILRDKKTRKKHLTL